MRRCFFWGGACLLVHCTPKSRGCLRSCCASTQYLRAFIFIFVYDTIYTYGRFLLFGECHDAVSCLLSSFQRVMLYINLVLRVDVLYGCAVDCCLCILQIVLAVCALVCRVFFFFRHIIMSDFFFIYIHVHVYLLVLFLLLYVTLLANTHTRLVVVLFPCCSRLVSFCCCFCWLLLVVFVVVIVIVVEDPSCFSGHLYRGPCPSAFGCLSATFRSERTLAIMWA